MVLIKSLAVFYYHIEIWYFNQFVTWHIVNFDYFLISYSPIACNHCFKFYYNHKYLTMRLNAYYYCFASWCFLKYFLNNCFNHADSTFFLTIILMEIVGIFFIDLYLKIHLQDFVEYLSKLSDPQNLKLHQVELLAPKLTPILISTTSGPSSYTFNSTSKNSSTPYSTTYLITFDLSYKLYN